MMDNQTDGPGTPEGDASKEADSGVSTASTPAAEPAGTAPAAEVAPETPAVQPTAAETPSPGTSETPAAAPEVATAAPEPAAAPAPAEDAAGDDDEVDDLTAAMLAGGLDDDDDEADVAEDEDDDDDDDPAARRREAEARLRAARSRAPKRRVKVPASMKRAPSPAPATSGDLRWYVVHTYSGYENKAKQAILQRVKTQSIEHKFGEVMVPTESVVEMRKGKRRTTNRKFFPGYILVQMAMDDETYHLVKNTPKVTSFLGETAGKKPLPVSEDEMKDLTEQMTEGAAKPKPKVLFEAGETVRVIDGPFSNFNGLVEDVRPDKGKLRVNISIFGRPTPVELDFMQVEKA